MAMTGRQIILPYSEMRIANAFKSPSLLTAEDIAEMQCRVLTEVKGWKRRKNRIENVGQVLDENEIATARRYSDNRRIKRDWTRRKLTEDEKDKLIRAWL